MANNKIQISFDRRARKEYLKLPNIVRTNFDDLFDELAEVGYLGMPHVRKLKGYELFEFRVKVGTIWRAIYAYVLGEEIILLVFFNKKSQKTPHKEIIKAIKRLNYYK